MDDNITTEVSTVNDTGTNDVGQSPIVNDGEQPTIQNDGEQDPKIGETPEIKPEKDFFDGDKQSKAFSARLNKAKEKITEQYEPYTKIIKIAAKQQGMSVEEYLKEAQELLKDEDEFREDAPKSEKDLLIEQLMQERQEKEFAEQWNNQSKALLQINKDISIEDISDEMLMESQDKNIPLQYLYAYKMLTENRENFEKNIRESAISDYTKVNKTTGSLTSQKTNIGSQKVSEMNSKDFNLYLEKIKRGEIKV